jgi:hypothetical protein
MGYTFVSDNPAPFCELQNAESIQVWIKLGYSNNWMVAVLLRLLIEQPGPLGFDFDPYIPIPICAKMFAPWESAEAC